MQSTRHPGTRIRDYWNGLNARLRCGVVVGPHPLIHANSWLHVTETRHSWTFSEGSSVIVAKPRLRKRTWLPATIEPSALVVRIPIGRCRYVEADMWI
jgi:hypothetical protein